MVSVKGARDFVRLMKIDLCLMLFMMGYMSQNVTVTQLMEDKMCLNQLHLNQTFCSSLTKLHADELETKSILRSANTFKIWQFVLINVPGLVLSVFLGYWLGTYPKYIKLMTMAPLASGILMMILLLLNATIFHAHWGFILMSYVPMALAGAVFLMFSVAYTYISWSTPANLMVIRFAALEFMCQMGILMATYVGGKVLAMDPWISSQPKNYIGVFVFGLICLILGLIFAYLMELEFTPATEPDKDKASFIQVLNDVFKLSRFQQPIAIFTKKRPNSGRLRLILLITAGAVSLGALLGEDGIAYQFAQRVYGLTEDQYTTMYSYVSIMPTLLTSIGPPFFRSFLHLSDCSMAIIGSLSMFSFYLVRGIFLSAPGYIAGFCLGSLNRLAAASARTLVTALVGPVESAQVFTLATALENYITLGATFIYTSVFSMTIDRSPGAIMMLMAGSQIYPLAIFCWSYFTRSSWQIKASSPSLETHFSPSTIGAVMTGSRIGERQSKW